MNMFEFEYRGLGPQEAAVEGRLFAADHNHANKLLEEMQIRVCNLQALRVEQKSAVKPISRDDFIQLNEQIIAMVKAGVPLEDGLKQMADDLGKPRMKKLVNEIADDLTAGTPLEEAIRKRQQAFPVLYAQIITVGIKTGKLAVVLTGLNRHMEFIGSIRRMVWETISYPLMIFVLGLCVMWFTTQMAGPKFKEMFSSFGTSLPIPTVLALKLSDNLAWLFPTMLTAIVAIIIVVETARSPGARKIKERFLLATPLFGPMVKKCLVARFTQALSMMVRIGVPLEEAVPMAGEATGSPTVTADSRRMRDALVQGKSVPQALQAGRVLPRFLGQTVQLAMERNQLHDSLEELADLYDHQARQGLSSLQFILNPLLIILLAGCIGFYILALFLPLARIVSSVSG